MRPALLLAAAAAAAAAAGCASSSGDGSRLPRRYDDETPLWTLTGYGWRADSEVEITTGAIQAKTDRIEEEAVRGGRLEAHLDRVSLLLDGFWLHASADAGGVEGDARYGRFDLSVALRLVGEERFPVAERASPVAPFLDGIAGLRTHFAGLHTDPPGFERVDQDAAWIEPMAGARAGVVLLRRLTLEGRADVSGLAYSDWRSLSTGAEATLRLDLAAGLGAFVGARWARVRIGEDDDGDGFDETFLDLRLDGVWAGVIWEF